MSMYDTQLGRALLFAQGFTAQASEELSKKAKAVLRTVNQNSRSPMQCDAGAYYFLFVVYLLRFFLHSLT